MTFETKHQQVAAVYESGAVRRYHTKRVHQSQTVADHAWGVAMLITLLHPEPSANLLKAALLHDVAEVITGDVPYTAKEAYASLKAACRDAEQEVEKFFRVREYMAGITFEEMQWLKAADMLELVLYGMSEIRMGNTTMCEIYDRGVHILLTRPDVPEPITTFVKLLEVKKHD